MEGKTLNTITMENKSKSNLEYQFVVILQGIQNEINNAEQPNDIDCNSLIESLEGIKEIQVALNTLTN